MPAQNHLLAIGVPAATRRTLEALAASQVDLPTGWVDVTRWSEGELEAFECRPGDALLYWPGPGLEAWMDRLRVFREHHPSLPILVRAREAVDVRRLLAAGFHEAFPDTRAFPESLRRARARVEFSGRPSVPAIQEQGPSPYEGLFQNLYDWIYVLGISERGEMTFETVNPPLHAGENFLNPDFAGRSPQSCLPRQSAEQLIPHFTRVAEEGIPLQFEEDHQVSGQLRTFQTILTPVRNKWGRIHRIAGISRDITALRVAEAELRASEERLNYALEGTQQGLWDWDLASGSVYRSPRWSDMLGFEAGDIAPTLEAGLALIHPEDRLQTESALHAHLEGRLAGLQSEYRLRTKFGEWLWVFDAGKVVAWTPEGRPARMAGMCTDITERRRAEESLRALVGGVVHEIRNPVYGISINLDALEATFEAEPRYRPFLAALRESADRIQGLMNDLRDYGEPRTLNPEPCRVLSILEEAVRSCQEQGGGKPTPVRVALEDESLVLPLNARRMHQAFRNLIENAMHHSPPGGVVTLTGRHRRDEGHHWWVFTVDDEGAGFAPEAQSRAFEPFFTRRKGGTGLGLSIVKRVVEEHGGTVAIENRPEGGARVAMKLPAPRRRMELIGESHA